MDDILRTVKKIIPKKLFSALAPIYHYLLAFVGAILYRFPSRNIVIVAVTGTKGKSSTTELINRILEEAGYRTALLNTVRFKIADISVPNNRKMTVPGRFFVQKFLRNAVREKCDMAILEMSSEAVKQFRHAWINLDALVVTNVSPEHIESHGSFEKYLNAKLELAESLSRSSKSKKVIVTNKEDEHAGKFIMVAKGVESYPFSLRDAEPYKVTESGITLTFRGETIESPLHGIFNIQNMLGAAVLAESMAISPKVVANAIPKLSSIRGRVEYVTLPKESALAFKQNFDVIVDYAHTIDSLTKLYEAFGDPIPRSSSGSISKRKLICVLGNTGGGRDKWKRKGMAEVADKYCDEIILTNEDPYDEDPEEILNQMKEGIKNKPYKIILDRREAIKKALDLAVKSRRGLDKTVVLISGKGTDPYIMGPNGTKIPWDDTTVVREELEKLFSDI